MLYFKLRVIPKASRSWTMASAGIQLRKKSQSSKQANMRLCIFCGSKHHPRSIISGADESCFDTHFFPCHVETQSWGATRSWTLCWRWQRSTLLKEVLCFLWRGPGKGRIWPHAVSSKWLVVCRRRSSAGEVRPQRVSDGEDWEWTGRLLPSDSAPGLQNGSGPSSGFLASCRHYTVSMENTILFSAFSLLLYGLVRCCTSVRPATAELVVRLYMVQPACLLFLSTFSFLF